VPGNKGRIIVRRHDRIPIRLFVDQYSGQEHWIGVSFNLSAGGLYLCQRPQPIPGVMGLELDLPGLPESIWTKAEVRSVGTRGQFMSIGVVFTAMANKHRRWLEDWVGTARKQLRTDGTERRATIRQLAA
jgi:hypothetical protein